MTNWPIFHEPWWLDATAGPGNWGECRVEENGELVARLPYTNKKKLGFKLLTQPQLTQNLGPWFRSTPPGTKYSQRLAREKDLTEALISQLPAYDYCSLNFSPEITNWLPWYWCGFEQSTLYTYRLINLKNLDDVWNGFQSNVRREIRKAQKKGIVTEVTQELQSFREVNLKTFERQGKLPPYSVDYLQRLDRALFEKDARRIFLAKDPLGRTHAGVYLVWNEHCAWYLMGGGDPEFRNSGATSLAMWEAIQFASSVSEIFDFEGSMMEPVERFFRGFGAQQVPYFQVKKVPNRWLSMALHGKEIFHLLRSSKN